MVDLGEGAKGMRFGPPSGEAAISVEACENARTLAALSGWPRLVNVFGAGIVVESVEIYGLDPTGVVRLHLRGAYQGHRVVGVLGGLPLPPRQELWWTWLGGSTVPLYGRADDVRDAVERAGLPHPAQPALGGPREVRRVRMLGGPMDGEDLETTCGEVECLGARDGGSAWRKPREGDTVTHVYYRVRRSAELDAVGPWWDEATLEAHEWVATFEGPRRLDDLLGDEGVDGPLRVWPERLGPDADRRLDGPQPGEHNHRRFRTCHPGCPLYAQPVPDRDTWRRVSGGRARVRELAATEFRLALEQQALVDEIGDEISALRRRQQEHVEARDVHYEVLHRELRMSDDESRKALAYEVASDDDADGIHLLRTVWLPKEYETWEREQS